MQLLSVLSLFVFRVSISFYFRRSCLLFTFYCHFGLLLIILELFFPSHILLQLIFIYYPYLFSNFKRLCCSCTFCIIVGVIFSRFSSNHIFSVSPHVLPHFSFLLRYYHHYSHFRHCQSASYQFLLLLMSCLWFQIPLISHFY